MRLLHIDASARRSRSHTRKLSALFVDTMRSLHPETEIVRRDLAEWTPPHVTEAWIAAAFTPEPLRTPEMRAALRVSDELVDELLRCDLYVFGVPMYNYSVPSSFKSYIDQIVRAGRTFSFDPVAKEQPYQGLVEGKRLFVITARGDAGYGVDGPHRSKNHLEPYVNQVFGFLGIEQIDTVAVENDEFGGDALKRSMELAETRVTELAMHAGDALCCSR